MGPSREACDRCHAMKTRCVREAQSHICLRCNRLGVSCHYSPPGRTGRPLGSRRPRAASNLKNTTERAVTQLSVDGVMTAALYTPVSAQPDGGQNESGMDVLSGTTPTSLQDMDFFTGQAHSNSRDDSASRFIETFLSENGQPPHMTASLSSFEGPSNSPEFPSPWSEKAGDRITEDMRADATWFDLDIPPRDVEEEGGEEEAEGEGESDDLLQHLLDFQSRVAKLVQSLSRGPDGLEYVQDIYQANETLIGILDSFDKSRPSFSHPRAASNSLSKPPAGGVVLLLSSCYFSLIHAYDFLVAMLRQELRASPTITQGRGETAATSLCGRRPATSVSSSASSVSSRSTGSMPGISVGGVPLAMPRKAVAEINLHLVRQTVRHLKSSMQRCTSHISSLRVGGGGSNMTGVDTEDGIHITDLVELTLGDLRGRESKLLAHLGTSGSLTD